MGCGMTQTTTRTEVLPPTPSSLRPLVAHRITRRAWAGTVSGGFLMASVNPGEARAMSAETVTLGLAAEINHVQVQD